MGALLMAGCATAGGHTGAERAQESLPRFASYVDVTWQHPSLSAAASAGRQGRFVLSFLLAKGASCTPVWGESTPVDAAALHTDVRSLLDSAGEVTVASGGALGTYLESSCHSATALEHAYRNALDATGVSRLDVDIEHPVPAALVAHALARLQRARPVDITVTLPVADAERGLDPTLMPLMLAVAAADVDVTVNAMVMNFPFDGTWRDAMLRAADSVARQIATVWHDDLRSAYHKLGLTVMAGRNDMGMTTTVDDARAVARYARSHEIASLGLWSLARDNGGCPGRSHVADNCSGVAQQPYEFSTVLSGATTRPTTHR